MNIQDDLFDSMNGISRDMRTRIEKIEIMSSGQHLRGLRGKNLWEAHVKKMGELFEDQEID